MFDFAWSEIALIGVVALVLIGPKDLPVAIRTITALVKKARRMAAEFQTHVDDMVKDADLHEVRDQFREIRNLDIRGTIARAVDRDGTIRGAMADPIRTPPPPATPAPEQATEDAALPEPVEHAIAAPPAFIPPGAASTDAMPAFIPPGAGQKPLL